MQRMRGFTLVEMMVVILIVAVLVAVAIPILHGRVNSAKWSEGKAGCGTIATALRSYAADQGSAGVYPPTLAQLSLNAGDLHGAYFSISNYSILSCTYTVGADPELSFVIQCDNTGTGILSPSAVQLNEAGNWTEVP